VLYTVLSTAVALLLLSVHAVLFEKCITIAVHNSIDMLLVAVTATM
jgi:hypothetical protein